MIEFFLKPQSYPHITSAITHIQTHISHVFIGDDFVYKIKKPVNMGFLDFTNLKRRHFFCEKEITLNSRLSPHIYLSVEPIYEKHEQFSFDPLPGGNIVEYAVKMKRIPMDCLLFNLIGQGMTLAGQLEAVGGTLSLFHKNAALYQGKKYGGVEAILAATEENFEQIKPFLEITVDKSSYQKLVDYTRTFIARHGQKFADRKKDGHIRDGHGDLHCQHICLGNPPVIFDCIEFNEAFRIIDVLEDIAFLLMDLEYRGRFDLSSELFRAYFAHNEEAFDLELLRFYKIYRAVVRGKVESFLARELDEGTPKERALEAARGYFMLADYYIRCEGKHFNPIVFMGLSGSGKSTIARRFSANAVILRSDSIRKEMAGRVEKEHDYSTYGEGLYTAEMTDKLYTTLLNRAIENALAGKRVIVDATYLKTRRSEEFYRRCVREGLNPFFIQCFAEEKILRERIKKRMEENIDISDASLDILEHQLKHGEESKGLPSFRIMRINTEDAIDNIICALREFL